MASQDGCFDAEPEFFLWELAFLLRRLVFCVALVGFREEPLYQGVCCAAAFSVQPTELSSLRQSLGTLWLFAGDCHPRHRRVEHLSI
jgi:hypothetical protein